MQSIVAKALACDPGERYASALDMAADLSMLFSSLVDVGSSVVPRSRATKLAPLPFFADFRDAEIWELLRWATWRDYATGDELLTEDINDDALYVLLDGDVTVCEAGRRIRALPPGQCFGEMAYLGRRKRSASVVANSAVSMLRLTAETLSQATLDCQVQLQRVFMRTLLERSVTTTEDLVSESADASARYTDTPLGHSTALAASIYAAHSVHVDILPSARHYEPAAAPSAKATRQS